MCTDAYKRYFLEKSLDFMLKLSEGGKHNCLETRQQLRRVIYVSGVIGACDW
jgi:hypothetical protein